MTNCYRCGVSDEEKKLFDAISGKGIVKICEDCLAVEKFPVVSKPVEKVDTEKQKSVRDRLIGMNKKFNYGREPNLRDLIDQKFKEKSSPLNLDLIDNFHWALQKIRRDRKVSRLQLAKAIDETEEKIKLLESGFLPDGNYQVLAKVENYFGINLRKNKAGFLNSEEKKFVLDNSLIENEIEETGKLSFDFNSVNKLKVGDLKEIDKERKKNKFGFWNRKKEIPKEENVEVDFEEEWSQENFED